METVYILVFYPTGPRYIEIKRPKVISGGIIPYGW